MLRFKDVYATKCDTKCATILTAPDVASDPRYVTRDQFALPKQLRSVTHTWKSDTRAG